MEKKRDVAVLIGSLRQGSYNRRIARVVAEIAPPSLQLTEVEIGLLPPYNADLEGAHAPREWIVLRERIRSADAVLFVTPEYNRSIPGVLKNAIDVASRPARESVWRGKPGAVISVSTGALGGFGANHHLRQTFVFLDIRPMQQPEAYVGKAATLFDDNGHLANDDTRAFLQKFIEAFASWIELQRGRSCA